MKFERNKRNYKRKVLLTILGLTVLTGSIITLTSRASYKNTQSIHIAHGTISYSLGDLNTMAIYVENENGYEVSSTIPETGYALNQEQSYCKIGNTIQDVTINYDFTSKSLSVSPYQEGKLRCYLYFDTIKTFTIQDVLATKTKSTRTDFSTVLTTDTTGTIYTAEDDYGTSYYFAGAPTDNWVKFAGFYWRIIRINGDGTIHMIYQGTTANTTGEGTQTITSAFNPSYNNNMYEGYMYTSGSVHGNGTTSTIKSVLDSWYNSNLSRYTSYIATGGGATFCNDRQPSTSTSSINGSGGTGTTVTYYAAYNRLRTNKRPTFKCTDSGDRFDTSVGLVTADEVAYAGGVERTQNLSYYLYTGQNYWSISPSYFNGSTADVFRVYSTGELGTYRVDNTDGGVRPVINLKADTQFANGGTGTASNPYVVS